MKTQSTTRLRRLTPTALALSAAITINNPGVAAESLDITNSAFSERSPNCAEYVAKYISSVKDVNNDVSLNG